MKKLYDARSKYVHEGRSVDQNALDEIEQVCTHTLWCVLATSATGSLNQIEDWLKQIDFVHAAFAAGKGVDEAELAAIGIPEAGRARVSPNRVLVGGTGSV